jgi:arabinofuranosyltransferase
MERFGEVLGSYASTLGDNLVGAVLAALAALAYVAVAARRGELRLPPWAPVAALALISILGVAWAWHLRWLADDAFISFRYANNWSEGRGLVFNVGERVEGYTNFLWTAILTGADWLGFDIPSVAIVLCLASHVGVLIMTTRLVRQLAPEGRPVIVSLAAVTIAASYLAASFATGGLETTFGALLVLGAVDRARAGQLVRAGALGIAATLAHPDHAIFYVALGGVLALRRTPIRQLAGYAAPFAVVYVPYFLARWHYYGLPLPNSYYTKSGGASYFSQGSFYLIASVVGAGLFGVLPLAIYGVVRRRRELSVQFVAVAMPLYLIYVAKIGGDFMLGRLLIPVLPFGFALAEVATRELIVARRWRIVAPALVVASLACVPTRIIEPEQFRWYLTDERTFYELDTLDPLVMKGGIFRRVAMLHRYLGGHVPSPVYAAYAIGIVGWVARWRVVDIHGLIDPELSRFAVDERGRPGHERRASKDHIYRLGADVSAESVYEGRYDELTKLVIGGETYSMVRYHATWLDPLRTDPTARFVRFPEYLDDYIAALPTKTRAELGRDLSFFERYYFATNPDPARHAKLFGR